MRSNRPREASSSSLHPWPPARVGIRGGGIPPPRTLPLISVRVGTRRLPQKSCGMRRALFARPCIGAVSPLQSRRSSARPAPRICASRALLPLLAPLAAARSLRSPAARSALLFAAARWHARHARRCAPSGPGVRRRAWSSLPRGQHLAAPTPAARAGEAMRVPPAQPWRGQRPPSRFRAGSENRSRSLQLLATQSRDRAHSPRSRDPRRPENGRKS